MGGGEMIQDCHFRKDCNIMTCHIKFEAGTPNVGDGVALEAAIILHEQSWI